MIAKNYTPNNKSLICGIGVNDADYPIWKIINGKNRIDLFYRKWCDMIKRCYSEKEQERNPSYKGCSVIDEWHYFMTFKEWMEKQDWEGKELDKDILIQGNKVYSPNTCIFVSRSVNALLCDSLASRGEYPQGVSLCNRPKKYRVRIKLYGKEKYLGRFHAEAEAEIIYLKAKVEYIKEVALKLTDQRVKNALLKRVEDMKIIINYKCQEVI